MKIALLMLIIFYLSFYAFKDWYKALCGLIVMMAVIERPDIPRSLFGITGLSPWNILFLCIILAWFAHRKKELNTFSLPGHIKFFIIYYICIIFFAYSHMLLDMSGIHQFREAFGLSHVGFVSTFVDYMVNSYKFFAVGLLMLAGCNSKERFYLGLGAILLLNVLLALQVVKWMPISELADGYALEQRAIRILDKEIGYFRSDLAVILAGASWAIYSIKGVFEKSIYRSFVVFSWLLCALAIALTGGRIGMAAWIVTGATLALLRWWRFFIFLPVLVIGVAIFIPSVGDRFTQGMADGDDGMEEADQSSMTSGRSDSWPFVIQAIKDNPIIGYGRNGMQNSGTTLYIFNEINAKWTHPHNAYFELLLDNGVFAIPVFIYFLLLLKKSLSLFRDSKNILFIAGGGAGFSYLLSHLIGSMGSQSFYPTAGSVSMWCVIALMLRLYYERQSMRKYSVDAGIPMENIEVWGDKGKGSKERIRDRFGRGSNL